MSLFTFGQKSVFVGSTRKETLRKDFCFSEFAHWRAESGFDSDKNKEKRTAKLENSVEIPNFWLFDNFRTRQKINQLLELKT